MIHKNIFTLAVALAFGVATIANAGSVAVSTTNNNGASDSTGANLANFVTNDLKVASNAGELIGAVQVWLQLTSGSVFNHAFGSNTAPNPAQFGLVPALEFDTYVASGFPNQTFNPVIAGASAELGSPGTGGGAIFDADTVDATFGPQAGQSTDGVTDFLMGRFTLSNDAVGTFKVFVDFSGAGTDPLLELAIAAGVIGPNGGGDNTPPIGVDALIDNVFAGTAINHVFQATDAEDAASALVWSNLLFDGSPAFGGTGVEALQPSLAPNGTLTWNTLGSARGIYTATATVTDTGGLTDTATLTINITQVPEPAALSLFGLALVGIVGLARRRS